MRHLTHESVLPQWNPAAPSCDGFPFHHQRQLKAEVCDCPLAQSVISLPYPHRLSYRAASLSVFTSGLQLLFGRRVFLTLIFLSSLFFISRNSTSPSLASVSPEPPPRLLADHYARGWSPSAILPDLFSFPRCRFLVAFQTGIDLCKGIIH